MGVGTVLACNAPYGGGGLGQHFSHVIELVRSKGHLTRYFAASTADGDAWGEPVVSRLIPLAMTYSPLRFDPGWRTYWSSDWFDRVVSRRLPKASHFIGFIGQSLRTFREARRLGYASLVLEAASAHIEHVWEKYTAAGRMYPLEGTWLNPAYRGKILREYEVADRITVASEYAWRTFVDRGVPERKLERRYLPVSARFRQLPSAARKDGRFRLLYVGGLTVAKGLPVLLEAFSHLHGSDVELILVGSWASPGMRRYMQSACRKDARIRIVPGDPLHYYQEADVYVHPSYSEGFGYSPMEALACGTPVIVTEDTGMKEFVREGVDGYVVPTGDWQAIYERLRHFQSAPFRCSSNTQQ